MNSACKLFLLLALIVPTSLYAQTNTYLRLSAGELFTSPGTSQTIAFSADYWKRNVANNNSVAAVFAGLSAGMRLPLTNRFDAEVGLGLYQTQSLTLNGKVYQYSSPQFYNMNYDCKIINQSVMLEGKLLTTYSSIYHPYISVGMGLGHNRSYAYTESPIVSYAVPDPAFHSATQNSFVYNVGLGVDVDVATQWRVGIGYQYGYLGKVELGASSGQVTSQRPSLGQITASDVLLTASYIL